MQERNRPEICRDFIRLLYQRRAVRDYTPQVLEKEAVHTLIDAAIQAPTARGLQPWSFAVLQDKALMNRLSEDIKEHLKREAATTGDKRDLSRLNSSEFNIFYNAGTLVLICGKTNSPFVEADCWLAAENLMLAATAMGLGSCVIGLAVATLNASPWRAELKIPEDTTVFAPIILGVPAVQAPIVSRKEPIIWGWR